MRSERAHWNAGTSARWQKLAAAAGLAFLHIAGAG